MMAKYIILQKTVSPTEFVDSWTSEGLTSPPCHCCFSSCFILLGFSLLMLILELIFSVYYSSRQQILPTPVPDVKFMGNTFYWYLTMYFLRLRGYFLFRILKPGINKVRSVTLPFSGSIRHAVLALSVHMYS